MEDHRLEQVRWQETLQAELEEVRAIAHQQEGDSLNLLFVLRELERLHKEICDTWFQDSLPQNRQALYALLRDIEAEGGWPYIHRMRLRSLLVRMAPEDLEALHIQFGEQADLQNGTRRSPSRLSAPEEDRS
ncbi:hypothetical protein [Geitlerinema sp. PCC 7407]|uniref:hypothetical protein n=1 Tax=Geitlerinema sp. PCC 7407 TaxID=1173025 RepID=UPI00029FD045|nr:hypothetical protein [Geitlerinema sp. PCC 7407]AFY65321.1 hypothetical protein GEI7407_0823 [Geitlerinema sp. PCC 7407]